jgi:uncharacterized membrane protein (UPF0127 family)
MLVALLLACGPDGPRATVHRADGSIVGVTLEVAETPAALERGLMYRSSMPENHGMLFVFPDESVRAFWMKNTLIPLDMLFIAGDGRIVGIRADTTPLSTAPVSVGLPSRFVLETNGGWASRHGVRAGDRVAVHGIPGLE